jgi:hypothetical protein
MADINDEIQHELSYMSYMRTMGQKLTQNMGHCNHCGNNTVHFTLMTYKYPDGHDKDEYEFEFEDLKDKWGQSYKEQWLIQECVTCKGLFLKEQHIYRGQDEYPYDWEEFKILYPVTKYISDNLPSPVMKAYEAALKIKPIDPSAFAVMAGKILEVACNHEKAQGRNLAQKLDFLAKSGRIPITLVEMAKQVRLLRNLAAHDAEDEVTKEDVPTILEFLDAILEYLYVAPAKIEAVRTRLKRPTTSENAVTET